VWKTYTLPKFNEGRKLRKSEYTFAFGRSVFYLSVWAKKLREGEVLSKIAL
jgi:hypothetical protein